MPLYKSLILFIVYLTVSFQFLMDIRLPPLNMNMSLK